MRGLRLSRIPFSLSLSPLLDPKASTDKIDLTTKNMSDNTKDWKTEFSDELLMTFMWLTTPRGHAIEL